MTDRDDQQELDDIDRMQRSLVRPFGLMVDRLPIPDDLKQRLKDEVEQVIDDQFFALRDPILDRINERQATRAFRQSQADLADLNRRRL